MPSAGEHAHHGPNWHWCESCLRRGCCEPSCLGRANSMCGSSVPPLAQSTVDPQQWSVVTEEQCAALPRHAAARPLSCRRRRRSAGGSSPAVGAAVAAIAAGPRRIDMIACSQPFTLPCGEAGQAREGPPREQTRCLSLLASHTDEFVAHCRLGCGAQAPLGKTRRERVIHAHGVGAARRHKTASQPTALWLGGLLEVL